MVRFESLREVLGPSLDRSDDRDLGRALTPEVADLLEDLASAFSTAGRELAKRAPGALAGAAQGFLVGGPAGAAVGAGLGAAGVMPGATGGGGGASAPGVAPTIALQAGGAANHPAAILTLLSSLLRPEVLQGLLAMAAGPAVAPQTVPVAGLQVPVGSFATLIQSLAGRAAAEHHARHAPTGGLPEYLGEVAGADLANPDVRAAALLGLLCEADAADLAAYDGGADAEDLDEQFDLEAIDRLGGID
jgi:hypothetical protein